MSREPRPLQRTCVKFRTAVDCSSSSSTSNNNNTHFSRQQLPVIASSATCDFVSSCTGRDSSSCVRCNNRSIHFKTPNIVMSGLYELLQYVCVALVSISGSSYSHIPIREGHECIRYLYLHGTSGLTSPSSVSTSKRCCPSCRAYNS